jgi:hypothetical protein
MSLPEFLGCFGTEAECAQALKAARWPDGFSCSRCDSDAHYVVGHGARLLFQCNACRHQTSLTAGSLMEHTKLPLTIWFLAICSISQAKTGQSALVLKRHLGVSYPTAWLLHHKINLAMAARESCHRLEGAVQVDDAYLGGECAGGKPGSGSENEVPFVAAVSLDEKDRPRFLKLSKVSGLTSDAIGQWAKDNLAPGCAVISDGLRCFAAVNTAGYTHLPVVVGGRKPRDMTQFLWVNTVLGNLETTLAGACLSLKYSKYAAHYLAAFAYRFNRRFDLRGLVARLIVNVVQCAPLKEAVVSGHA